MSLKQGHTYTDPDTYKYLQKGIKTAYILDSRQ